MNHNPHWLLEDLELLEQVKEAAADYTPTFRPDDIFCHDTDASYSQATFRFYQAGSSLSAPTAEADESTDVSLAQEGSGNYALQLWIVIEQTDASADLLRTKAWKLQVSHNSGAYTDVDSAAQVNMVADSGFADGDAITALPTGMSAGNGSFINGEAEESTDTTDSITFTQNAQTHTVCCWSIEVVDAQVAATDTLDFRVVESDSTVLANDATSDKPRITWASAGTTLTPDPAAAAYAANTPTVTPGAVTLTPSPATAAWSGVAPTVTPGEVTLAPDPATAAWVLPTPSVSIGVDLTPDPATAAASVAAPSLTLGAVTLTPSPGTAAWGTVTPSLTLGALTLTPDPGSASWATVAPDVSMGVNVVPDAATAALSVPTPGLALTLEAFPDPAVATWSTSTPALSPGALTLTPDPAVASWSVLAPSITTPSIEDYFVMTVLGRLPGVRLGEYGRSRKLGGLT